MKYYCERLRDQTSNLVFNKIGIFRFEDIDNILIPFYQNTNTSRAIYDLLIYEEYNQLNHYIIE
jgi:hypothetical protein